MDLLRLETVKIYFRNGLCIEKDVMSETENAKDKMYALMRIVQEYDRHTKGASASLSGLYFSFDDVIAFDVQPNVELADLEV